MLNCCPTCTITSTWSCSERRGTSTSPDSLSFSGCKRLRSPAGPRALRLRNLFSSQVFCFRRVMKRVVTLINQLATASTGTAAFQAQAETANKLAEKLVEDNELLKEVRRRHSRWVQDPDTGNQEVLLVLTGRCDWMCFRLWWRERGTRPRQKGWSCWEERWRDWRSKWRSQEMVRKPPHTNLVLTGVGCHADTCALPFSPEILPFGGRCPEEADGGPGQGVREAAEGTPAAPGDVASETLQNN